MATPYQSGTKNLFYSLATLPNVNFYENSGLSGTADHTGPNIKFENLILKVKSILNFQTEHELSVNLSLQTTRIDGPFFLVTTALRRFINAS